MPNDNETKNNSSSNKNRFKILIELAEAVDAWRIFPRAFISIYIYMLWATTNWFMALTAPTVEQAGLMSVITGIGAAWFALYVQTGTGKSNKN